MNTKLSIPNELNALQLHIKNIYADDIPDLEYIGCEDAPPNVSIPVRISRCEADAKNPLSCVIAKNIHDVKANLEAQLPIGFGKVMRDGVSITSDRAYIAVKVPGENKFKVIKFNHNGAWVVNAFDSEDPVRLKKMWSRVDKGGDAAIVLLKRFRPSQTTEGRAQKALEKAKRDALKLMNGEALDKPKQIPQRGNRKAGISPRRAKLVALAQSV